MGDREVRDPAELVELLQKALSISPPAGSVERVWERIRQEVFKAGLPLHGALGSKTSSEATESPPTPDTPMAVTHPSVPVRYLEPSPGRRPAHGTGKSRTAATSGKAASSGPGRRGGAVLLGRKRAGGLLVAVLALVVGLAATASAAEGARPGNPLYSLKRGREAIRLWLAGDERAKAEVRLLHAERRLDEAAQALKGAKYDTALELMANYGAELAAVEEIATRRADVADMLAVRVQASEPKFEEVSQGLEVARARVPPEGASGLEVAEAVHERYRDHRASPPTQRPGPRPGVGATDRPPGGAIAPGLSDQGSKWRNG